MSHLAPLFTLLEDAKADELRLTPNERPRAFTGGEGSEVSSQPLTARLITEAAQELLSQEELADLPSSRPRTVRHEHEGVLYVIEISKGPTGIGMLIRPAKRPAHRIEVTREAAKELHTKARPRSRQMRPPSGAPPRVAPEPPASSPRPPASSPQPPPSSPHPPVSSPRSPASQPDPSRPTIALAKKDVTAGPDSARSPSPAPAPAPLSPRVPSPPPPAPAPVAASPPPPPPPEVKVRGGAARIDGLLREMLGMKASDLHLSAGNHPVLRVHGEIHFAKERPVLTSGDIHTLVHEIITDKAQKDFAELRDADFAYEIAGLARFRVNVFEDRNGVGAVLRQIPVDILTTEQLGLPKACTDLCWLSKGLVVVTGPTGSGKSTTLAAMIDYINKNRSDHIITIEDPVEFVHKNIKCLVNQREVGQNTKSFKGALRAALREDPDIVLVGEMRDLETIAIAIETAETGHLVFGTLHTTTAISTVDRIIDQFPTDRQAQIRVMLSESLKGVIAQNLCKKVGGGRVAAHEILLGSSAVTNLVREGKTFQLASVMQTSKNAGMVTMNDSLLALVQSKQVEPKEAWLKAVDKAGLLGMFKAAGLPVTFA